MKLCQVQFSRLFCGRGCSIVPLVLARQRVDEEQRAAEHGAGGLALGLATASGLMAVDEVLAVVGERAGVTGRDPNI